MRNRTVNYWINQISAEENKPNRKEPQDDKDLTFQVAKYYVAQTENNNQSKVA
jgi:hypothetical protein